MNALSSNFVGIQGALVMAAIALSIVFIIIAGLMFWMMGLHAAVVSFKGAGAAAKKEA